MDIQILEQLKNISAQLEKITKLLEEKKSFPPRRDSFQDRKPFGKGGPRDFDRKPRFSSTPRFDADGKPRIVADGRKFGFKDNFKDKKRNRF